MIRKFFASYKSLNTRKYKVFFLLYFLFFLANGPLENTVSLLVGTLGFTESQYGVFLSITTFVFIFTPTIIAYLSDRVGPYVVSITMILFGFVGALLVGLNLTTSPVVFLFIFAILMTREVFNFSIGNKVCANIEESQRSKYFSMRDLFLYGAISLGLFAGGYVANQYGVFTFYLSFSFLSLATCIVILSIKRQKLLTGDEESAGADEDAKDEGNKISGIKKYAILLKQKTFLGFASIEVLTSFYASSMNFVPLLGLSLGFDVADLMTLMGIVTLVNALGGLVMGYLFESGRKTAYVVDMAFDVIPAILFAFTQSIPVFVVAYVINALKNMLAPVSFAYFFDCFSEEEAPLALGALSSLGNIAAVLAPLVISLLWTHSRSTVFIVGALANGAVALIAMLTLPNTPKAG